MKFLRCVITGWPCTGTLYMARTLLANGINATHEGFLYNEPEGHWQQYSGDDQTVCDVNYAMHQWLHIPPVSSCQVVLLLRDPVKVLASWMAKSLRMGQAIDPEERMRKMVEIYWTVSKRADRVHKVEDGIMSFYRALSLVPPRAWNISVPKATNAKNLGLLNLTWADLEKFPSCEKLRAIAFTHNYL